MLVALNLELLIEWLTCDELQVVTQDVFDKKFRKWENYF